jgi:hypothetical protein
MELQKSNMPQGKISQTSQMDQFRLDELKFIGNEIDLSDANLSIKEKALIYSLNYLKINEIPEDSLKSEVFIIISNALRSMSSKMLAPERVLLTNDFIWELNTYFPLITIKEFELIVNNGIRKRYDTAAKTTIGLSIVNFNIWHKAYREEKEALQLMINRRIELQKSESLKKLPPAPVTIESIHQLMNSELDTLQDQKNANEILFALSCDYIYRKLVSFGVIEESNYISRIKDVMLPEKKRASLRESMEEIISKSKDRKVSEAKRLVLIDYFNQNVKK